MEAPGSGRAGVRDTAGESVADSRAAPLRVSRSQTDQRSRWFAGAVAADTNDAVAVGIFRVFVVEVIEHDALLPQRRRQSPQPAAQFVGGGPVPTLAHRVRHLFAEPGQ